MKTKSVKAKKAPEKCYIALKAVPQKQTIIEKKRKLSEKELNFLFKLMLHFLIYNNINV